MKLWKHDHVLTAYAEPAAGPGWANAPLWLIIRDARDGSLRRECLQPDEQTSEMRTLYPVCAAAHLSMLAAVERKRKMPT